MGAVVVEEVVEEVVTVVGVDATAAVSFFVVSDAGITGTFADSTVETITGNFSDLGTVLIGDSVVAD